MDQAAHPTPAAAQLARVEVARGELLDPSSLSAIAAELAHRQAAQLTREAYAGVYRAFCQFLGPDAGPEALTPESVRAYRDQLERHGRSPATIAKHLSALRTLASELGVDRDLALLHVLGTAGLRRAEACALLLTDVDERRHASDGRLRRAIPRSTSWWVAVQYGKRGRRRAVPARARRARRDRRLGQSPTNLRPRAAARLAAENRTLASAAGRPRRYPDRRPPRAARRAPRRPPIPARPAPDVLHPPRRIRRGDRGHPRARRPRRHPHHHDLHRRLARTPPERD
jgi:hypothetical protein